MQYFGLNTLEELPALPEFREADLDFQKKEKADIVESNKKEFSADNKLKEETSNDDGGDKDGQVEEATQEDR